MRERAGLAELIMSYDKPLPWKDPESAPFWEGCARHELLIPQCRSCGTFRFPPTSLCPHCHSPDLDWRRSPGNGKIFSWIVVRHPVPRDAFEESVPYVVALVELPEGVRMVGNIQGCGVEEIEADMPVAVTFRDIGEGVSLPVFRPTDQRGTPS